MHVKLLSLNYGRINYVVKDTWVLSSLKFSQNEINLDVLVPCFPIAKVNQIDQLFFTSFISLIFALNTNEI